MKQLINLIREIIGRGQERSIKAKKNILFSFLIRGGSMLVSFFLIRLTVGYVGNEEYGIWMTLSSFVAWFGFFDIGLGNGLRNKFAEALAKNQHDLARTYISTSYAGLLIIFGGVLVIFLIVFPFVDWVMVFNTSPELGKSLKYLILIVFVFFIFRLVLGLIGIILMADQRPALGGIIDPVSNVFILLIIFILTKTTEGSLLYLGLTLSAVPVVVMLAANIFFFSEKYKKYKPSLRYVKMSHFKDLINLGFRFFIIQIAVLIIFSTDNMIITQVIDPGQVTPYEISRRYFGFAAMAFGIILKPFWSAFTEAIVKQDTNWIKGVMHKLRILWIFLVLGLIGMVFISNWFIDIWLAGKVTVPFSLAFFMAVYFMIASWNDIHVQFINGSGKIKFQFYASIVLAIVNIPLSIWLAKDMGLGTTGVILGTCLTLLPGVIINPYQVSLILNKKDRGIWSK